MPPVFVPTPKPRTNNTAATMISPANPRAANIVFQVPASERCEPATGRLQRLAWLLIPQSGSTEEALVRKTPSRAMRFRRNSVPRPPGSLRLKAGHEGENGAASGEPCVVLDGSGSAGCQAGSRAASDVLRVRIRVVAGDAVGSRAWMGVAEDTPARTRHGCRRAGGHHGAEPVRGSGDQASA